MSTTVQIKRGNGAPSAGVLSSYELGWDVSNNSLYIGVNGSSLKIADAFASYLSIDKTTGDLTAAKSLTVQGNLTVQGTTTTIDSTVVTIADPIFSLGQTLLASDGKDRGIEFKYGTTAVPKIGFFGLDQSSGRFTFIPTCTNTSEVFSGLLGDYEVGEIYQPQLDGVYNSGGVLVNASQKWNEAAKAMGGASTAVQYDLLQADADGIFQPTKTLSSDSGITIDCGTY